jgi:hypothetical protein
MQRHPAQSHRGRLLGNSARELPQNSAHLGVLCLQEWESPSSCRSRRTPRDKAMYSSERVEAGQSVYSPMVLRTYDWSGSGFQIGFSGAARPQSCDVSISATFPLATSMSASGRAIFLTRLGGTLPSQRLRCWTSIQIAQILRYPTHRLGRPRPHCSAREPLPVASSFTFGSRAGPRMCVQIFFCPSELARSIGTGKTMVELLSPAMLCRAPK